MLLKKLIASAAILAGLAMPAVASAASSVTDNSVRITDARIVRDSDAGKIDIKIDFDFSNLKLKSISEITVSPVLKSENSEDSISLPPFVLAGRNRYLIHERQHSLNNSSILRLSENIRKSYSAIVTDAAWIDNSKIYVSTLITGCCNNAEAPSTTIPVAGIYVPRFNVNEFLNYVTPVAEPVKERQLSGRAFVDFPVNQTVIHPDYRRNSVELAKITATIDSVRNDSDISIRSISIKGFASPEGPWNNNVRLAKGRTEALKHHIEQLYNFDSGFIKTSFEPEDWQGLIEWLNGSAIDNRDAILEIAKSNMEPDVRDNRIRHDYLEQYEFILQNVYPALRHSDYVIDYTIRKFTSVDEILHCLKTQPGKLSLNELFRAASTMEPGSAEFNELFETAVRLYPDNEVANLNAANTAMANHNIEKASRYLEKAGDSPSAIYARGLLSMMKKDYLTAIEFLRQAARLKVADAPRALSLAEEMNSKKSNITIYTHSNSNN